MRKALASRRWMWVVAAVALVVAGWFSAKPVRAILGNVAVPVYGYMSGALAPGDNYFMICTTTGGPGFSDGNQRVPNGYYFVVTDITVTPDGGTSVDAVTDVTVYDSYGASSRETSIRLRGVTTASYGVQYTTPYFVLAPGHRIEIVNAAWSQEWVMVRLSGLLVTNLNYLPLVSE